MSETDAADAPDDAGEPSESGPQAWLLGLGALALILIPTLIGISLIRGSGGDDGAGADMGGMGGDTPAGAVADGVLDLLSIVDGDIAVDVHGDGTATVFVTTTIDVACAISYGPTEALGSIATDSDMAGGGHTDHHPLLVNLSDNTDYFYRISAIGPDGAVYSTTLRSFTNGASSSAAPGPNIAIGASVTHVSSEFSASFGGGNAVDGDRTTEWSSAGDGDEAFIVIDLGTPTDLSGVGFRTREMSDGTSITESFTVTIDDGAPLGPFAAGPGLAIAEFAATGQVVRIDVETSTGGNTGAIEIEVYGTGDAAPLPTPTTAAPDASDTLTTPPAPMVTGVRIHTVSSEAAGAEGGLAIDGDPSTAWVSTSSEAEIIIDLGEEFDIAGVGFRALDGSTGTTFTASIGGTSPVGPFDADTGLTVVGLQGTGTTVRIEIQGTGSVGAAEIEIYGAPTM